MHTETVLETNDIETVVAARAGDTLGYARVSTNDQTMQPCPPPRAVALFQYTSETPAVRPWTRCACTGMLDRVRSSE